MGDPAAARRAEPAPDLARQRRVHLVGVGGAGMSAIATVLAAMGHEVTGSDAADSPVLARLSKLGVEVHVGHDPGWLGAADIVAVSTAIPTDDPEIREAAKRGLPVWRRSDILAAICRQRRTVAVSGSHGKTTTTAMLATILRETGMRPALIVGGDLVGLGSGAAWEPGGEWMVVEADESDGTFLALGAEAVVVTSVGSDHAEFYGGEEGLADAFGRFVAGAWGPVVICVDDPGAAALAARLAPEPRLVTYGTDPAAMIGIVDVALSGRRAAFSLVDRRPEGWGPAAVPFTVGVPGLHNVRNAAAAVTMAVALGVPRSDVPAALASYRGVGRRFETRGERDGVTYIDDYAHNPEKVTAAIAAARDGDWGRIVAVFQPHRYSRTEALWRQFGPALGGPDVLFVTDIYPAGEAPRPGVTGRMISDSVAATHPELDVRYVQTLGEVAGALREELRAGDLCLTLGAGDITRLPDLLLGPSGTADA